MKEADDHSVTDGRKTLIVKREIKDSVFSDLFRQKKYLVELYHALHPGAPGIDEEAVVNVTIRNVLVDKMYNDLAFCVGDRLLSLVEAQSTWSSNIVVREMLYLSNTYHEYITEKKMNVYGSKKIALLRPELYVLYTGDRKKQPEILSMTEEFFGGEESALEVKVKVLCEETRDDIVGQYIAFTRICNEQIREHGRTQKAVERILHICRERNILKEYLESREKEVKSIMNTLFDQEYLFEIYVEEERRKSAKRAAQRTSFRMADMGMSVNMIAQAVEMNPVTVQQWLDQRETDPIPPN